MLLGAEREQLSVHLLREGCLSLRTQPVQAHVVCEPLLQQCHLHVPRQGQPPSALCVCVCVNVYCV